MNRKNIILSERHQSKYYMIPFTSENSRSGKLQRPKGDQQLPGAGKGRGD